MTTPIRDYGMVRCCVETEQGDFAWVQSMGKGTTRLRVVRQPRLGEEVVQQLTEAIVRGEIPSGSSLPTEPRLIEQLGVSRTVVREALKVLETKGLVETKHGRGTVVLHRDHWNLLDPDVLAAELEEDDSGRLFEDLTRVRIALEREAAQRAAVRASKEQLRDMEALVGKMRGMVRSPEEYLDADVRFHDMVTLASGNRVAKAVMRSIEEPLKHSRRVTNRIPGGVEKAQEFHEAIFEQLRRRNAKNAGDAMQNHLLWSWKVWLDRTSGDASSEAILAEFSRNTGRDGSSAEYRAQDRE